MIVALVGSDLFSKNQKIDSFLASTLGARKDDPLARKILYATDTNIPSIASEIMQSCDSIDMFAMSDSQTVVVRRADAMKAADTKALAKWLEGKPDCSLLLEFEKLLLTSELGKALKKAGADIQKFEVPKPWEMEKWILDLCRSHFGKNIEPGACRYLADAIGTDTACVAAELEKVQLFAPEAPAFTEELVRNIIVPQREMSPYEIKDSFGDRDARAYVLKLHELMVDRNVEGVQIVSTLFSYAVQLLHTSSMLDKGMSPSEIAKELGINEFIFTKKNNEPKRARNWGTPLLCRLIKRLAELDYDFKNGKITSKIAQELALSTLVIPPR